MKRSMLLLAAALTSVPAHAVDLNAVRKVVTDDKSAMAPGCVVGAFKAGKTLFVTSAGYADIEGRRPLDGDTLIYAASVAKQFTTLTAAKLAAEGKLDLDADIRRYIPELPQYEVPVTTRMLIHHTSGIRDSLTLLRLAGFAGANEANKAQTLDLVLRQKDTNFTPGTDYTYSNGGYLLLAEIVERISGMPFAEYATKNILKPLGMNSSVFMNDSKPTGAKIAHGYNPKDDGFEIRDTYPTFSGSGGLLVTINDLAKFDHDIEVGHKVWTPAVTAIMLKPGTFTNGAPALRRPNNLVYAGGLMIGSRRGQKFVQHGGGAEAFKNQYARLPERRLGVAVFCNRGDWDPQERADRVIELVEGDILTDDSTTLAGRYVSDELQSTYDVSIDGDRLLATISSPYAKTPKPIELTRNADGSFQGEGYTLTFDPDGNGFVVGTGRVKAMSFKRAAR